MKRKITKNIEKYGELTVKAISIQYHLIAGVIAQVSALWLAGQEQFFPGTEVFQQLAGTCAEIVAGLYGITMASYTFFLSRMDSLTAADATLDYVVSNLKRRFKNLTWYITGTVAAALGISVIVMYYPASDNLVPPYYYRLLCNEFLLFLAFSIVLILYYSVSIIDPNAISNHAAKLKRKLSSDNVSGNSLDFIALYDRIDAKCLEKLPPNVAEHLFRNKGNHFAMTVDLLDAHCPCVQPIMADLIRLHRYYSCMINCKSIEVSKEMCDLAKRTLLFLDPPAKTDKSKNKPKSKGDRK